MFTISQLCKKANTSIDTIRFYEKKGLLLPKMKAANQYRYYDSSSLDKLNFILNCRNLGLSIQDISSLLKELDNPNQECSNVNDLIRQHIQQLDDKIIRLMSFKNQLDVLENSCGTDRQIKNCYIIKKLESTD